MYAGLSFGQKRRLKVKMLYRQDQFVHLQSDLEVFTEVLSDVVARRRLRAAKSQVDQARMTARSKRIDFEQALHGWRKEDAELIDEFRRASNSVYSPRQDSERRPVIRNESSIPHRAARRIRNRRELFDMHDDSANDYLIRSLDGLRLHVAL
jgi:hypothetical protein